MGSFTRTDSGELVYQDGHWTEMAEETLLMIAKLGHIECDLDRDSESVACFCPYGMAMRMVRSRRMCLSGIWPHRLGVHGDCEACREAVR